jgi:ankyrin repeat protein
MPKYSPLKNHLYTGRYEEFCELLAQLTAAELKDALEGTYDDNRGLLYWAAVSADGWKVIDLLVQTYGADANKCDKTSALHVAVERSNVKNTEALIRNGARLDVVDRNGDTPCHLVRDLDSLKLVLTPEVLNMPNNYGSLPLHNVAKLHDTECIVYLYAHSAGVDLTVQDHDGNTPLHCVTDISVARFLLSKGASPTLRNKYGETAAEATQIIPVCPTCRGWDPLNPQLRDLIGTPVAPSEPH